MHTPEFHSFTRAAIVRLGLILLAVASVAAACGASGDAEEPAPSNVGLSVTSGSFTTTVRAEGLTTVPFSETVIIDAVFENSIYGSAGQTSVYAAASPNSYRIGSRPRRNERTFTFSLSNRGPGTVEVSIYEKRGAAPVTFILQVGEE